MREKARVPLQGHHYDKVAAGLDLYDGDVEVVVERKTREGRVWGYYHTPQERALWREGLTLAYEAVREGRADRKPDGFCDVICMGCFQQTNRCRLRARRDAARRTWPAMKKQLYDS